VLLSTVIRGFVVRTLALFRFVHAVVTGLTRRGAWLNTLAGMLSRSSAYRLWLQLREAQSTLRARLSAERPTPACTAREPLAQLLAHVGAVVGATENDLLEGYQQRMQRGIFER
jgi:hypothetical protein